MDCYDAVVARMVLRFFSSSKTSPNDEAAAGGQKLKSGC